MGQLWSYISLLANLGMKCVKFWGCRLGLVGYLVPGAMAPTRKKIHSLAQFELDSLVLAKFDKFLYWPAVIRKYHKNMYYPAWKQDRLLWCHFINDDCGAWVHFSSVKPFEPAGARPWRSRKGLHANSQSKEIDIAIEIYERRSQGGDGQPLTF